jgi:hypothetical protein
LFGRNTYRPLDEIIKRPNKKTKKGTIPCLVTGKLFFTITVVPAYICIYIGKKQLRMGHILAPTRHQLKEMGHIFEAEKCFFLITDSKKSVRNREIEIEREREREKEREKEKERKRKREKERERERERKRKREKEERGKRKRKEER